MEGERVWKGGLVGVEDGGDETTWGETARRRHIRDESARDARRTSREVTTTRAPRVRRRFPRVSTSRRRSAAWVSARAALGVPATLARDSIAATAWRCRPSPLVASRASRVADPSSPLILDNDSVADDTGGSSSDEATGAGAPARFFALPFAIASASHDRWTNDDAGQQKASGDHRAFSAVRPATTTWRSDENLRGKAVWKLWARPFFWSGSCAERRITKKNPATCEAKRDPITPAISIPAPAGCRDWPRHLCAGASRTGRSVVVKKRSAVSATPEAAPHTHPRQTSRDERRAYREANDARDFPRDIPPEVRIDRAARRSGGDNARGQRDRPDPRKTLSGEKERVDEATRATRAEGSIPLEKSLAAAEMVRSTPERFARPPRRSNAGGESRCTLFFGLARV